MKLNELTITKARELLDQGKISALELTQACLSEIEEKNDQVNACISVFTKSALNQAQLADQKIKQGDKGALLGIPYLVKDNLLAKGKPSTASSKMLANYIAPYDATVVKKLNEAGAILLGKTNLDEFGFSDNGKNSIYGPSKNPHDLSRGAGGSSGGSATALGANFCLFSLGTDTGGSIREPASYCGLFGLKPSYGRISRFGMLSMTSTTDVIGPFAKTSADLEAVMSVIAGPDELDATSVPEVKVKNSREIIDTSSPHLARRLQVNKGRLLAGNSLQGLKFGVIAEFREKLAPELKKKLDQFSEKLKTEGATISSISLKSANYHLPVYHLLTTAEVSSNLARLSGLSFGYQDKADLNLEEFYQANRSQGFGHEAKMRILFGTYVLSPAQYNNLYLQAQKVRTVIMNEFFTSLRQVDFLLSLSTPTIAPKLSEKSMSLNELQEQGDFLSGASLAGLSALSLPFGEVKQGKIKLPIGLQLIAPRFFDEVLLELAKYLENKII